MKSNLFIRTNRMKYYRKLHYQLIFNSNPNHHISVFFTFETCICVDKNRNRYLRVTCKIYGSGENLTYIKTEI